MNIDFKIPPPKSTGQMSVGIYTNDNVNEGKVDTLV